MRDALPLVVLALLFASEAQAHVPGLLSEDGPTVVEDSTISRLYVGELRTGGELFVLRLSFAEDFALPFELFVPHRDRLREHRPAFAVVGPGLPRPTAEVAARLPRPVPEGQGAFVELNEASPRVVLFEGVLRRVYWTSEPTALALRKGEYEIWIWSPRQTAGELAFGMGVEERFDLDAVSELFAHWSDYAY